MSPWAVLLAPAFFGIAALITVAILWLEDKSNDP
jgi:hypothetical protein